MLFHTYISGVTNNYFVLSYYQNLKLDDLKVVTVINDSESLYGDLCNDGN